MLKTLSAMVKKLEKVKVIFVCVERSSGNGKPLFIAGAKSFRHMQYRTRKAAAHKVRRTRAQS